MTFLWLWLPTMPSTRLEFLTRLLGWLSPCYAGGESEYNHAGSVRWRHDDLLLLLLPITAPTVNLSIAVGVSMVILLPYYCYYLLLTTITACPRCAECWDAGMSENSNRWHTTYLDTVYMWPWWWYWTSLLMPGRLLHWPVISLWHDIIRLVTSHWCPLFISIWLLSLFTAADLDIWSPIYRLTLYCHSHYFNVEYRVYFWR